MAQRHIRGVSLSSSWGKVTAMSGHASGKVCGVSDICFALTSRAFVHTQCDQYYLEEQTQVARSRYINAWLYVGGICIPIIFYDLTSFPLYM